MPTGVYERTDYHKRAISKSMKGIIFNDAHKEKLSLAAKRNGNFVGVAGEKHFAWKGDKVTLYPLHRWVERQLGKPMSCENCGMQEIDRYEWANISGLYKRDVSDWARLCVICHRLIDDNVRKSWATRKNQVKERI